MNAQFLEAILAQAAVHRQALDRLLLEACAITGEAADNSFTSEAVFYGSLTTNELIRSVEAGHYVRDDET